VQGIHSFLIIWLWCCINIYGGYLVDNLANSGICHYGSGVTSGLCVVSYSDSAISALMAYSVLAIYNNGLRCCDATTLYSPCDIMT